MMLPNREPTHPKKRHCMRCDQYTTFLYDHGLGYYICSNCELD